MRQFILLLNQAKAAKAANTANSQGTPDVEASAAPKPRLSDDQVERLIALADVESGVEVRMALEQRLSAEDDAFDEYLTLLQRVHNKVGQLLMFCESSLRQ